MQSIVIVAAKESLGRYVMFEHFLRVAVIVVPTITAAHEQSKVRLVEGSFQEVIKSAAEISGARFVGLARFGPIDETSSQVPVAAFLPETWAGQEVCLSVMSVDGLYQSSGTYSIDPSWLGGRTKLTYPSAKPEIIAQYNREDVAPLISKGACGNETSEFTTAFWGQNVSGVSIVFLNTSRAEETYIYFPDYPDLGDVLCNKSETANRTAFDTLCHLPSGIPQHERLRVSSVSFKGGEMGREVNFDVFLAKE
ncbi:MAG: hypothetical protein ACRBB0_26265 [Pelagimonas sp.]|uniref:hypothetical protein n=1 Tax=Pelagimonas sp. TaxID=2073170 RepID=UPI003D6AD404